MKSLCVQVNSGSSGSSESYDVWVGQSLFLSKPFLKKLNSIILEKTSVFILCDQKLSLHGKRLQSHLAKSSLLSVRVNEELKSVEYLSYFYGQLIQACPNRHSVLIVLGGGVLGDLGGYLAATYLRGIRWINIPTTLLSQVDSSIGGKTGVNHPSGKNLIGAFHQPTWVVIDVNFLSTLPRREWISGWGEVVKMALTFDPSLYQKLKKCVSPKNPKPLVTPLLMKELEGIIYRSVFLKKKVVEQDEKDLGVREHLNFGHTVGHALEAATHYKTIRHGEAVFFGMMVAVYLSQTRGVLNEEEGSAVNSYLREFFFPPKRLQNAELALALQKFLNKDKKQGLDGSLRFVCLKKIGQSEIRVMEKKAVFEACMKLLTGKVGLLLPLEAKGTERSIQRLKRAKQLQIKE